MQASTLRSGARRRRTLLLSPLLAFLAMLPLLGLLAGCVGAPVQDSPEKVRHDEVYLPPLFTLDESEDGTSWSWDALLWLFGEDVEGERRHARALPIYWHESDPPFGESLLVFPFYYSKDSPAETRRWYSLLWGRNVEGEITTDFVLAPIFYLQRSDAADYYRSGLFLIYDWGHNGERNDVTFISLLGLATLAEWQSGLPAAGVNVPALGRSSSRRMKFVDVLGIVTLFGYDDVGDRREVRLGTLFSNQPWSLFRSWRSRDPLDPFVSEWLFPVYMNRYDDLGDGFHYIGPLWGGWADALQETETDWWALGLLARNRGPVETTWRVLGIPVSRSATGAP